MLMLVMLKALETHVDILQIRFRINANLNTTPFCPKKLLNASKDNAKQKISLKSAKTSEDKIEEKMPKDVHKSIKRSEIVSEHYHNTKLV